MLTNKKAPIEKLKNAFLQFKYIFYLNQIHDDIYERKIYHNEAKNKATYTKKHLPAAC